MNQTEQTRENRLVLLLVAGIPVTMLLAASWLWYFVVRGDLDLVGSLGTANQGALVQPPRQLDDSGLFEQDGYVFKYADLEPKWTMLIPAAGGDCAASCERSLYVTRQIHVAMGKEFNRLRRLYVSDTGVRETTLIPRVLSDERPAPATFTDLLQKEHRGLKSLVTSPDTLQQLFAEHRDDPSTWYLVDPAGWVMMSYDGDIPYKDVMSDLKFLLKNSAE